MPPSLREWVKSQATITPPENEAVFPYSEFWWRAVGCVLLSGRVRPKWEKNRLNLTDLNRFCKAANFNQYYFQNAAEFLLAGEVVTTNLNEAFRPGKRFEDFWSRDLLRIEEVAQEALVSLISRFTPFHTWRPTLRFEGVLGLLRAFFAAFEGRALAAERIGGALLSFSKLPESDLASWVKALNPDADEPDWTPWLDENGQTALRDALYTAAWACKTTISEQDCFCLSVTGRVMLGLEPAPPVPPEVKEFKVLPDLSVLAGADLDPKILAVLFRYCRTKRIDRVLQFRVDKAALKEMPSASPEAELLNALKPFAPLPATVLDILEKRPPSCRGVVLVRSCRGLVKVENPELLSLIRAHPRLKGYPDRGGPPGFLTIKEGADVYNFIQRCQEHGFEVKSF